MKLRNGSLVRGMAIVAVTVITASAGYADKSADEKGFIRLKSGEEVWTYYPNSNWQFMVIEGDPKNRVRMYSDTRCLHGR